jgi:hypothetical protein
MLLIFKTPSDPTEILSEACKMSDVLAFGEHLKCKLLNTEQLFSSIKWQFKYTG